MILFKSFNTKPQVAAKKAVVDPIKVIINNAVGLNSNKGEDLSNKNIPAVQNLIHYIFIYNIAIWFNKTYLIIKLFFIFINFNLIKKRLGNKI